MAVKLRCARFGAKKHPVYRVVATDTRSPRDGRFLEQVGYYDPHQNPPKVVLEKERVRYWLSVGAQPSPTVATLLKNHLEAETD